MQKTRHLQISNKIKISNTARIILMVIAIAIFALGSGNIIKSMTGRSQTVRDVKEKYRYTNKLNITPKINLKTNEYIQEDEITENQTYLSDLISNIDIDFDYKYSGTGKTNITYDYKIEAIVSATYMSNNKSYDVLNKTEVLKEVKDVEVNGSDFSINEKTDVDYSNYHQLIKKFKQEMGISTNSYLYVRLTVDTKTNIDGNELTNEYVSDYNITLGDKVSTISYKNEDEKSDAIKYEVLKENVQDLNTKDIIIGVVEMLIGLGLLRIIIRKTEKLNTIRNEFKLELNRIMRSCESKLVEIEDLKQIDISNATRVKDISQLLKLSDEALVPIYCYIKDEPEQEAYFIVTKYEKSYIFILR